MEQDAQHGVDSFMQRVSEYLQMKVQEKSELYDIDFLTVTPHPKPTRYIWESLLATDRESLLSIPSVSTTESRTEDSDLPVEEEGEIRLPADSVNSCSNKKVI